MYMSRVSTCNVHYSLLYCQYMYNFIFWRIKFPLYGSAIAYKNRCIFVIYQIIMTKLIS